MVPCFRTRQNIKTSEELHELLRENENDTIRMSCCSFFFVHFIFPVSRHIFTIILVFNDSYFLAP